MHKRYHIFYILLLCAALVSAGCAGMTLPPGSGNVVREERSVAEFTAISVCCGMQLEFTQGDQTTVELEGDDNLLAEVETVMEGDQLIVRFQRPFTVFSFMGNERIRVYVTAPTLEGLDLSGGAHGKAAAIETETLRLMASGGSQVDIDLLQADDFVVDLSGGAEVAITDGTVVRQAVEASGGSQYHLENVQSSSAELNFSGGSQATIRVSETLRIDASGGSQIAYHGAPTVDQNSSGGSQVRALD
jgi:hypothetical protein